MYWKERSNTSIPESTLKKIAAAIYREASEIVGRGVPLQEQARAKATTGFFKGVYRLVRGIFSGGGKKTTQTAAQAARRKAQRDLATRTLPKPTPKPKPTPRPGPKPVPKPGPKPVPKPGPRAPKLSAGRRAALEAASKSSRKGFLKKLKDLCKKHPKKCKLLRWAGYAGALIGAGELFGTEEETGGAPAQTGTKEKDCRRYTPGTVAWYQCRGIPYDEDKYSTLKEHVKYENII